MSHQHRAKRDPIHRAYQHGYVAAMKGRSNTKCPYTGAVDKRGAWLGGWRDGKAQQYK